MRSRKDGAGALLVRYYVDPIIAGMYSNYLILQHLYPLHSYKDPMIGS